MNSKDLLKLTAKSLFTVIVEVQDSFTNQLADWSTGGSRSKLYA